MGIPHGLQSNLSLILWGWAIFSCTLYWTTQHCAGWPFRTTVAGPREENTFVLKKLVGCFWSKEEGRKSFNNSKNCTKDLRKYGWHNFWNIQKISLKSQIFLCTSSSFVFSEEGTYAESRGINFQIPKEQYQRIWIYLKLSLKVDLEYWESISIVQQWKLLLYLCPSLLFSHGPDASNQLLLPSQKNSDLSILWVLYGSIFYKTETL